MYELNRFNLRLLTSLAANINSRCCHLQFGWRIKPTRLREMADWIDSPAPSLRRIQDHEGLSTCLAILAASDFVTSERESLKLTLEFQQWLDLSSEQKIQSLLLALDRPEAWQDAASRFHLQGSIFNPDRQWIVSYLQGFSCSAADPYRLQLGDNSLRILVPGSGDLQILFHLLHFTKRVSSQEFHVTQLSLSAGLQRGYTSRQILDILFKAQGEPLSPAVLKQLQTWFDDYGSYDISPVLLLTTRSAGQLAELMMFRKFRKHVSHLISPRHAIVSAGMISPLERWLEDKQFPLIAPGGDDLCRGLTTGDTSDPHIWIALRVLWGLREFIPLNYPSLGGVLHEASASLSDQIIGGLELRAKEILADIGQVVRGTDAFFPPNKPVSDDTVEMIESAVMKETRLMVTYQGLGDRAPRFRVINPQWLERRDNLYYLHAYCTVAEDNRVFRLDRMIDVQSEESDEPD